MPYSTDLQRAATSPLALALHATRGKYQPARHLRLLNRKLLDLAGRRLRKLAVFMPPRHGKSQTCSHFFPAWYLGAFPDQHIMLAGYNAGFGATWGRRVRDTIQELGPDVFGIRVRDDSSAANQWQLADHEGGMLAGGVGGAFTGHGANLLIIDDPVKNAEEALSLVIRQAHRDWYDSTAETRLEPGAIECLIMTRWHADDLGGHVLNAWRESGEPFEVVKLPALAKDDDPLGRRPGEALWPERFGANVFERRKRRTPFWYSAMFDQEPTPEGGAIFQAGWFKRFRYKYDNNGHVEGCLLADTGAVALLRDCVVFGVVDPALGKKRTGDDVAIGMFAITPAGKLLVLHMVARLIPVEQLVGELKAVCDVWEPQFVGMEANGFQVTLAHSARKVLTCPVREIEPGSTAKLTRAVPAVEAACRGDLYLPDQADWSGKYLTELTQWTASDGDKDNQVDVTAYAAQELETRYGQGDGGEPVAGRRRAW